MTVIQIAGTSGSGKTWAVRSFFDWARKNGSITPDFIEGRNAPFGYKINHSQYNNSIYVLGAYEAADTAGCDTIKDATKVFDFVLSKHNEGYHVLFEGLFVMSHVRGVKLAAELGDVLCVLQLKTLLSVCFDSINLRRATRGQGILLDKHNTQNSWIRAKNYCVKMRVAGARVFPVSRDEALPKMLKLWDLV